MLDSVVKAMEVTKDIFISYRNDGVGNNFAARITSDLREAGYSVYFNSDEVRSGDFPERLRNAISSCKDFICIVTDSYIAQLIANNSVCWVREELLWAKKLNKNIVPVLINNTSMPADSSPFPEEIKFFPYIDAYVFPENYSNSPFSSLCDTLISRKDGKDGFRDVYKSNEVFDPDESLDDILSRANNGDLRAMISAGIYYYYGISGDKDERKAATWFKKVSDIGGDYAPIANNYIARMYYAGSMPRESQSYSKSYEYHVKAATQNDIYSAGNVGFMMSIGSGCDYDYNQTESYFLSILDLLDNPRKDTLCQFYVEHGEFKKAAEIYMTMADTYPSLLTN